MNNTVSPKPIVVGIDGSDAAIGAVEWAAKEAVHQDIWLRLVHIVEIADGSTGSVAAYPAEQEYAESSLRAACLAVAATGLPVKVETTVLRGDVDVVMVGASKSATLICVGSIGMGRVGAAVLGSTAVTLAERAHCPVAIIRRDHEAPLSEAGSIAVILDDQPGDDVTMYWAMEQARMRRAPVLVLAIWPWPLFDIDDERFYHRLDCWLQRYPDVQVEVATTRLSPTRYLEGYVGAVQLVVIGSDDDDRVMQLVGPHKLPIVAHADCSVLVARAGVQKEPMPRAIGRQRLPDEAMLATPVRR